MRKKKKDEELNKETNMENPEVEVRENEAPQEKMDDKDQEIQELKDKYLRLYAEFDNYKKRTVKEKMDLMLTAAQDTMTALLPALDDFDRAKKNADDENSPEVFSEGVQMIYHKIFNALKQKGLEPMQTDGEEFDPEIHEAITEIPAPSEDMKGKIIDTVERGYRLNSRIIRFAKVVVGK
ncbi:MAG: nucleotide exchange factor GrpE [Saprospiraceae bacterium]|nr:nucleotide exchange factor GrpE [Saprospiraceae bacterium]